MPLDEIARRYADRLFQNSLDEIVQHHSQRLAEIRLDHARRNMATSGPYFAAYTSALLEQIRFLGEAKASTLLKAYEKSGLPFDDAALHEIKDEVMRFCHQQQHNAVASVGNVIKQAFAGASAPPNLDRSCVDQIVAGVTSIMSRLGRDLLIRRDEVMLEESKIRRAYGAGLGKEWDVFVCHASEDKEGFVRPLAVALEESGLTVWYDEFALKVGDSLRRKIDEGLANSRYGIVVLSSYFFAKNWPQQELDGLVSREAAGAGTKVILPIWHGISVEEVRKNSPLLSGRLAAKSTDSIPAVVSQLREAMGLGSEIIRKPVRARGHSPARLQLVRDELGRVPNPWQRALLRELLVRGRMDEAHASGFLLNKGFGQRDGALNGLEFHTSLVVHDAVGYYSANPDLREALSAVLDEQ